MIEGTGSFEEAENVLSAAFDALNRGDLDAAEELCAPGIEIVTRDGTQHGPAYLRDFWSRQLAAFDIEWEVERVHDAGGGAVIVEQRVTRRNKETGGVELRAWPAAVVRVRDGSIVFFEGYQDRRKAFADLGLEQPY